MLWRGKKGNEDYGSHCGENDPYPKRPVVPFDVALQNRALDSSLGKGMYGAEHRCRGYQHPKVGAVAEEIRGPASSALNDAQCQIRRTFV